MLPGRQVIETLSKTTKELEIQSEVSSILNSIITDIETAHSLENKLNHDRLVSELRRRCNVAEEALKEYKALNATEDKKRQEVGAMLLRDLMAFEEKSEGSIEQVTSFPEEGAKSDTEAESTNITQPGTEENGIDAKKENQIENITGGTEAIHTCESSSVHFASKREPVEIPNDVISNQVTIFKDGPDVAAGAVEPTMKDIERPVVEETRPHALSSLSKEAFVTSKEQKRRSKARTLHHLEGKLLMSIFEYMDALDIVNLAQTNIKLYSKVNSIFGLGGTILPGLRSEDEDSEDEDQEEEDENDDAVLDTEQKKDEPTAGADFGGKARTSSVDLRSLGSSTSSDHQPTIVPIPSKGDSTNSISSQTFVIPPPKDDKAAGTSIKPTTVRLPPKGDGNITVKLPPKGDGNTTAKLPPKGDGNTTVKLPPKGDGNTTVKLSPKGDSKVEKSVSKPPASNRPPSSNSFQISPAIAQSMATKLLPAELSAIIAMKDQLRKKEEDLQNSQAIVNDLTAQLEGTISVKDVLTAKVKDLQKMLDTDREVSAKIVRQTTSDQEVIAFLDERVQELEKAVDNYHEERTKANKSIDKVKQASERQVAVLTDMLTYEREQKSDQEKEWKSTKKVLVKEVKHCRAQIMTLEAERDGFQEENDKLKQALLSLGSGSTVPKGGRSFDTATS